MLWLPSYVYFATLTREDIFDSLCCIYYWSIHYGMNLSYYNNYFNHCTVCTKASREALKEPRSAAERLCVKEPVSCPVQHIEQSKCIKLTIETNI
jgi:hypothetical protein